MFEIYKTKIYAALLLVLGVAIWHVSARYHAAGWEKEKTALVAKALETTTQRQELADRIGKTLEEKLAKQNLTQTTIHQKVIRETIKEPVYTQCRTTDAGVRLLDEALSDQ